MRITQRELEKSFGENTMSHCLLKTTLAAAVFAAAAFTVSAANPFADVDDSSWAYQAVSQLSDQGVVDGYPDGTFRGDKNVSRYEMSQIIARLMAKENTLNASQKATVDKLAGEYADELKSLGVRVAELEKKTGHINTITELRVQDVPRYDNVYKDSKSKHDELSLRVRLNTIANVNDRTTVYSQLETYMSMNGKDVFQPNKYGYDSNGNRYERNGYGDGDFHMNRLWATYQFGPKQTDFTNRPFGPSKNLIGIGQFPVKMGVTGYTYDGQFKGIVAQFGDYVEGGHLTVAYGRATDINYDYTGPMMRGMKGLGKAILGSDQTKSLVTSLSTQIAQKALAAKGISPSTPGYSTYMKAAAAQAASTVTKTVMSAAQSSSTGSEMIKNIAQTAVGNNLMSPEDAKKLTEKLQSEYGNIADLYNPSNDTLYPMRSQGVEMNWNEDEDVPVAYASYIFWKPQQWEFHAYGMTAVGPVGKICRAYGFAGAYYVTPQWHVQGEFVKNVRRLPLNNERPYSFNYGLHYGTADVLKAGSYELGLDYIYSQAGTYFGGSSNDIVDQYMGHVYKNWKFQGQDMGRTPAYIADKLDAIANGTDSPEKNYGGAKFFLAKASFVPMRGLQIEADYGFNAKDMGGRKMDNMFMLRATAYIK